MADREPFAPEEWGKKLDQGRADEPTLSLAHRLQENREPAQRPAPAYKRHLRSQLLKEAEVGPRPPVVRWAGAFAAVALLAIVATFALAWLTERAAPPSDSFAGPIIVDRDDSARTPTPVAPADDRVQVDQPAPEAPDYVRVISVSPGSDTLLAGEQPFTIEVGYQLRNATAASIQVTLGDLGRQAAGGEGASFTSLASHSRVPSTSQEERALLTGTFRGSDHAWMGPSSLSMRLNLSDAETGVELYQVDVHEITWAFEPRLLLAEAPTQPRFLWVDDCDPRMDREYCHLSDSLEVLADFYAVVADLNGLLDYALPQTIEEYLQYDVVIANFCGSAGTVVPLLEETYQRGGSLIVMGDSFCKAVPGPDGLGYSSAAVASLLTDPRGIFIEDAEEDAPDAIGAVATHPVTLGVSTVYAPGANSLRVYSPARVLVARGETPFIALEDGTGTLLAIPRIGFNWSLSDAPDHDNFVFWRNALRWLSVMSTVKRTSVSPAITSDFSDGTPTPDLDRAPGILVTAQTVGTTNRVFVDEVFSREAGWLAIHLGDASGPVLAVVAVGQGLTQGVVFDLPALELPTELSAVLHQDLGEIAAFEFPGPDEPVSWEGAVISASFSVARITPTPWLTRTPMDGTAGSVTPTPWLTPPPAGEPGEFITPTPWLTPTPEPDSGNSPTPTPLSPPDGSPTPPPSGT